MRVKAEPGAARPSRARGGVTRKRARPVTESAISAVASSADAYFPRRRRHDLEALTAYGAYRRSHEIDAQSSDEPARIEAEGGHAGSTALQDWEGEGGTAV